MWFGGQVLRKRKTDRAWRHLAYFMASVLFFGCGAGPATQDSAPQEVVGGGGEVWGEHYFPNTELTTHRGEKVRFFDDLIKDKVVAINFVYTSCPDACPMETARLLEVQRLLGDRMGKDVHFYSISIDPERDTVPVLADYVRAWNLGPGWTFLRGTEEEVIQLQKKLGVYNPPEQAANKKDHKLSLVIGNQATGRWMRRSPMENPYVLATQLGSWLHNYKLPPEAERPYEEAPEIRTISAGENLFRTRCAACHTVGGGETDTPEDRRIGPDLYNIHKLRDREWLSRWMRTPDEMVASGDPTAAALVAQYRGIVMPNLRLSEVDVDNVLGFLAEESARLDKMLEARAAQVTTPPPVPAVETGDGAATAPKKAPCH